MARFRPIRGLLWIALELACVGGCIYAAALIAPFASAVLLFAVLVVRVLAGAEAARMPSARPFPLGQVILASLGPAAMWAAGAYLIEMRKAPAGSMAPTLAANDHFYVLRTFEAAPGDVVIFRSPLDSSKDYVKRVVAVAGDTVQLQGSTLWVNGRAVPRKRAETDCDPTLTLGRSDRNDRNEFPEQCEAWTEELGGRSWVTWNGSSSAYHFEPFQVPQKSVFVIGDNRDFSFDSRQFGAVPLENIKGRALFVMWSRSSGGGVRWERIAQHLN